MVRGVTAPDRSGSRVSDRVALENGGHVNAAEEIAQRLCLVLAQAGGVDRADDLGILEQAPFGPDRCQGLTAGLVVVAIDGVHVEIAGEVSGAVRQVKRIQVHRIPIAADECGEIAGDDTVAHVRTPIPVRSPGGCNLAGVFVLLTPLILSPPGTICQQSCHKRSP